jgi:anti-anti-sigma factor
VVEKNLIFNCSGMNYISSSGLRVFLVAQKKAKAMNGKLFLCEYATCNSGNFQNIRIFEFIQNFATQEEALENQ